MSNVDTRTAVVKALKDTLALDDGYLIQDDQLICEDLGADSLDIRVICLDIEYMCRIDIPYNALDGIKTVRQLVDLADRQVTFSHFHGCVD